MPGGEAEAAEHEEMRRWQYAARGAEVAAKPTAVRATAARATTTVASLAEARMTQ